MIDASHSNSHSLALTSLAVLLAASPLVCRAWTVDESPRTVSKVGAHPVDVGFVAVAEGLHSNCLNQVLYFNVSNQLGKAMLSTLMIAKFSGQKVREVCT